MYERNERIVDVFNETKNDFIMLLEENYVKNWTMDDIHWIFSFMNVILTGIQLSYHILSRRVMKLFIISLKNSISRTYYNMLTNVFNKFS